MNQNNPNPIYAALGIAGQVGIISLALAIGALLVGLWLDRTFETKRILVLICLLGSVPINLFVTLRVTQRMIARVIPPDKPKTGDAPAAEKSDKSAARKPAASDDGEE